ncbi:Urease accessory protein UreE [Labeo rohita]|uniref:Urease accessory protein UreE n=1 Tax=Labeo rohita TaxID=84645 RepID=A0ABQ8LFM8_LABRO|nr:Urease accessory protein UreE [Labeo rohita]
MVNLCLPLSAGKDTFELEAVEKQIHELLEKQAELRERRATLVSSRADAHKSEAWCTQDTIFPGLLHSRAGTPRTLGAAEDASQAPGEDLSIRNHFTPLCETERDAVISEDSIVRHVLAKGKVHTHFFPGAHILDGSGQIPTILKDNESIGAIVLHAGVNVIKLRQI